MLSPGLTAYVAAADNYASAKTQATSNPVAKKRASEIWRNELIIHHRHLRNSFKVDQSATGGPSKPATTQAAAASRRKRSMPASPATLQKAFATASPIDDSPQEAVCNCKKSRCLKLYCDCFSSGITCSQACKCANCQNGEKDGAERQAAMKNIVRRNPYAFKPKVTDDGDAKDKMHVKGCNCLKTRCLKKYCECYQGRVSCNTTCSCVDCMNTAEHRQAFDKLTQQAKEANATPQEPILATANPKKRKAASIADTSSSVVASASVANCVQNAESVN